MRSPMSDSISPLDIPVVEHLDWPRHAKDEYPILACVQFDATGHHALQQAILIAKTHKRAPLHIAYVIDHGAASGTRGAISRQSREFEDAEAQLRDFVAARLASHELGAETLVKLHVRIGEVVPTVLQLALDYDVEMIIVGTHGRTGVRKLAFGSVAQKLVEEARCPLLIATPRDFSGMSATIIPDPPR